MDSVVSTLHDYVSERAALERRSGNPDYKVHLLGHGVSGVIALLYARQYPARVASLSLLSVSATPAVNWQAHYYALRQLLPCSRAMILAQMSRNLFGDQPARFYKALAVLLQKDLDSNLTLHSLTHHTAIPSGSTEVPLLVCNGEHDSIVCSQKQVLWHEEMKTGDRLWHCPEGSHFFHFHHDEITANVIAEHIAKVNSSAAARLTDCKPSLSQSAIV